MNKMNPKVKEKWVAALRSTAYKQGRFQLRNDKNEFCCLGVLCNLHAQEHPEIAMKNHDPLKYDGEALYLSKRVCDWAGMKVDEMKHGFYMHKNPPLHWKRQLHWSFITANDDGVPFRVIADYIEKNL